MPGQHWPESSIARHFGCARQSADVVGWVVGACDGVDGLWLGRVVGTFPSPAVYVPVLGSQVPNSSRNSEGCALGKCEGWKVGVSVFWQQPKYKIAPVCCEIPGQHWPESCISRHLGWARQSPRVVGDAVLGACEGRGVGLADGGSYA